jgi:hypothetical protein
VKLFFIALWVSVFSLPGGFASDFVFVEEYKNISSLAGVDKLGNIYSIENGVLRKHTASGETISYSKRSFGPVTSADVSDPLNILVFFGDFGHVVMLDKNLAEKRSFNASDLMATDIPAKICFSSQNGFWVWYAGLFKLIRYNDRGIPEISGVDLSLEFPYLGNITYMHESNEQLFIAADGVWVFDRHANFLYTLPDIQTEKIQVTDQYIFSVEGQKMKVYDFFLRRENVFLLPETGVEIFFVLGDDIFLQTKTSLKKYRFSGNFH